MIGNARVSGLNGFHRPSEHLGLVVFLFSAVFFVIAARRSGDVPPGFIAALLFLFVCAVLLLPYLSRALSGADSNND